MWNNIRNQKRKGFYDDHSMTPAFLFTEREYIHNIPLSFLGGSFKDA